MDDILNGGFHKHTYLDMDGRRKPADLLIECHEFIRLSQALQEKMWPEAASFPAILETIAHDTPPAPPLPSTQQQGHQTVTI
jgi:hypothetical protein